jgi:phosphatidate cytidylyltransferase
LLKRIGTGVIGIPVLVGILVLGNPIMQYAAMIISLIGIYEFYQAITGKYHPIKMIGYLGVVVYFVGLPYIFSYCSIYVACLLLILLITMVFCYPKYTIIDIGVTLFAPLYIGFLLSFSVILRNFEYGDYFVWLIFIAAWGSDTFAYFSGKLLGKHKLAPQLSPKKTIEGAVGGAIGAALLAFIYTWIYTTYFQYHIIKNYLGVILFIVFIAAIISQIGDLVASSIKRSVGMKDFGDIFPGHGGVLDRFDSVLLVAPFLTIAIVIGMDIISL